MLARQTQLKHGVALYLRVSNLVPALVRGDGAANLGQHIVTVLQGVARGVTMGDLGMGRFPVE